jgi:hypothetical protein
MAMTPITREQRDEAELERLKGLMESLAEKLTTNFNSQLEAAFEQVGHQVDLLAATTERPSAVLH